MKCLVMCRLVGRFEMRKRSKVFSSIEKSNENRNEQGLLHRSDGFEKEYRSGTICGALWRCNAFSVVLVALGGDRGISE